MSPTFEIVFIDDNKVDCFIHEKMLRKAGVTAEVKVFLSGKEGLAYLKQPATTKRIIFLDIQMPVMNGFDVLEEYSTYDTAENGDVLMMLSSSNSVIDQDKAAKFKVVKGYQVKPLTESAVVDIFKTIGIAHNA